jgi:hypothetical protein
MKIADRQGNSGEAGTAKQPWNPLKSLNPGHDMRVFRAFRGCFFIF